VQAVSKDTQVKVSTHPNSLHAQSQPNTDTFDNKLNDPSDTQEVKLRAQAEKKSIPSE